MGELLALLTLELSFAPWCVLDTIALGCGSSNPRQVIAGGRDFGVLQNMIASADIGVPLVVRLGRVV